MHRDNRSHLTHAGLSGCLQCGDWCPFGHQDVSLAHTALTINQNPPDQGCMPTSCPPACMCNQDYATPDAESDICAC